MTNKTKKHRTNYVSTRQDLSSKTKKNKHSCIDMVYKPFEKQYEQFSKLENEKIIHLDKIFFERLNARYFKKSSIYRL
jgi:hypothetical protein